jgi:hypothetical protein
MPEYKTTYPGAKLYIQEQLGTYPGTNYRPMYKTTLINLTIYPSAKLHTQVQTTYPGIKLDTLVRK